MIYLFIIEIFKFRLLRETLALLRASSHASSTETPPRRETEEDVPKYLISVERL